MERHYSIKAVEIYEICEKLIQSNISSVIFIVMQELSSQYINNSIDIIDLYYSLPIK